MNRVNLSNISLSTFRNFLRTAGCELTSTEGGHEKWKKKGMLRSIIIQTHIDPLPEFVLRKNLQTLGITRAEFEKWYLRNKHKKRQ